MKVRYTDPAIEDFQQATAYFLEHAPFVAADFADSVDRAIAQLRENPFLVQKRKEPALGAGTSTDFAIPFTTRSTATNL